MSKDERLERIKRWFASQQEGLKSREEYKGIPAHIWEGILFDIEYLLELIEKYEQRSS